MMALEILTTYFWSSDICFIEHALIAQSIHIHKCIYLAIIDIY